MINISLLLPIKHTFSNMVLLLKKSMSKMIKNIIGKWTVYGFAKYMRNELPNAIYLGFTGTSIENVDVNTPAVFANYVDIYDISQAVEDCATVRIFYESRLAQIAVSEDSRQLIKEFDDEFSDEQLLETQKERSKWVRIEGLIGSKERIKAIAADIVQHFELTPKSRCK